MFKELWLNFHDFFREKSALSAVCKRNGLFWQCISAVELFFYKGLDTVDYVDAGGK